jgi:hypothetical protein
LPQREMRHLALEADELSERLAHQISI